MNANNTSENTTFATLTDVETKDFIEETLMSLGIPTHIKGFAYLTEALFICYKDKSATEAMTKGLYPGVANICETTGSRVERAMRHAVETAFDRNGIEISERFFYSAINPSKGKPTNSEFIATIARYLRKELRNGN